MGLFERLTGRGGSATLAAPVRSPLFDVLASILGNEIASAPRYEEHVAAAIAVALAYFDRQIETIPGPFPMSGAAGLAGPGEAALLAPPDDVRAALGRSVEVREVLPGLERSGCGQVFALLGSRRRASASGLASLPTDHTLKGLAPELDGVRAALRRAAFERLVKCYDEHLDRLRRADRLLRIEWNIENDPSPPIRPGDRDGFVVAAAELTPANLLRGLLAWLGRPDAHLRVEAAPSGGLPVLCSADRRRWSVCLVRFPTRDGIEAIRHESHAHRYLFV